MDRRGLKHALSVHPAHHFKVAADDARIPQNAAHLLVPIHRNALPAGRLDSRFFAAHQPPAQDAAARLRAQ